MRDNGILKGFVQNFDTFGPKNGLYFGFRKMTRDNLNKLHVPFYDPCCPDSDDAGLAPIGYDATAGIKFYDVTSDTWLSVDSASSVTALTAHAGGGQGSATQLAPGFNEVTVAATAGDSVKLPAAIEGLMVTVKNDGAARIDVFPATADTINDGTVNVAVSIPAGGTVTYTAISAVNWENNAERVVASKGVSDSTGASFAAFYFDAAQGNIVAGAGGAIPVINYLTTINSDAGGDAFTLANGTIVGQMKKILLVVDGGGDGVVTPATAFASGATTATFNDAGDFLILMWNGAAWRVLENSGVTVA